MRDPVDALRAEIETLRADLAALRADHQDALRTMTHRPERDPNALAEAPVPSEPVLHVTSRRRLLALAAGAAAGAVALSTSSSSGPVAAANGSPVNLAGTTATDASKVVSTFLNYSPSTSNPDGRNFFVVSDDSTAFNPAKPAAISGYAGKLLDVGVSGISSRSGGNGVFGWATHPSSTAAYGVYGVSVAGPAVVGDSATGYDFHARGTGRVFMKQFIPTGPPATGAFSAGEIIRDGTPDLWMCAAPGTPATWKRLATSNDLADITAQIAATNQAVSALSTHVGTTTNPVALVLITPTRVYDSCLANQASGNTGGRIGGGATRTVSVANGIDIGTGTTSATDVIPSGATGIICNLTVAGADGGGYLAMLPGDTTVVTASTINWSPGISDLANGTTVKLDAQRRVTIVSGGGGSVDFIIDVVGYYR